MCFCWQRSTVLLILPPVSTQVCLPKLGAKPNYHFKLLFLNVKMKGCSWAFETIASVLIQYVYSVSDNFGECHNPGTSVHATQQWQGTCQPQKSPRQQSIVLFSVWKQRQQSAHIQIWQPSDTHATETSPLPSYLLTSPRLPGPKFDVSSYQLISTCVKRKCV